MSRRVSSLTSTAVGIDRSTNSEYDTVKIVADNIDDVLDVAAVATELEELYTNLDEILEADDQAVAAASSASEAAASASEAQTSETNAATSAAIASGTDIEFVTLTSGQVVVEFTNEVTNAIFLLNGDDVDNGRLLRNCRFYHTGIRKHYYVNPKLSSWHYCHNGLHGSVRYR